MTSSPRSTSEAASTRDTAPLRVYFADEVIVEWRPALCGHSGVCVRSLPAVFDPTRRPWIDLAAADPDGIVAAVARCPSGALRARRQHLE